MFKAQHTQIEEGICMTRGEFEDMLKTAARIRNIAGFVMRLAEIEQYVGILRIVRESAIQFAYRLGMSVKIE